MFDLLEAAVQQGSPPAAADLLGKTTAELVNGGLNLMIGVSFSVGVIMLAYMFFQIIMTAGEPKAYAQAWTGLIWTAISMMVAIAAIAVKGIVLTTIGVDTAVIDGENPF